MPTTLVFLIDLVLATLAVEIAGWLVRTGFHADATLGLQGTTIAASAAVVTAALGCYLTGLHTTSLLLQFKQVLARVALVSVTVVLATLTVAYFIWYQPIGRVGLGFVGGLTFVGLSSWRLLYGRFIAKGPRIPMVVLGTGEVERRFATRLNGLRHTRYEIRGFVAGGELPAEVPAAHKAVVLGAPAPEDAQVEAPPVLGELEEVVALCRREAISHAVVVGVPGLSEAQVRAMSTLQANGIRVNTAANIWMNVALQVPIDMVDVRWVLNTFEQLDRPMGLAAKRLLDLAVSGFGLLVFGLMFPLLWLLQRIDDPGPFFYSQDRVGLAGQVFRVHKIRTMRVAEREEQRWASKTDDRTTRLGRLLRRLRIDEFPQFWNVLRGEMSLVGPRPERPVFIEAFRREIPGYMLRH